MCNYDLDENTRNELEEAILDITTESQQLSQVELPESQVETDENDAQIIEPESLQEENTEDKPA